MDHKSISDRLTQLGIVYTSVPVPVAHYMPYSVSGNLVFISGQLCMKDGVLTHSGRCGDDIRVDDGYQAARQCGINVLTQLCAACRDTGRSVRQCVKLGVFVNSTDTFYAQPTVADGVSDLMVEVFGDSGRHARAALACNSLPLNAAVEVEAVFELS